MAVTTTNLGVITAYGDAVAAGYTGTKAEWQALMASYATVGQQAVDAKNAAVAAKDTAVSKATEATTAANTATTKANEASASAQSIAQSAAQIQENTDSIDQLKSELRYITGNVVINGWQDNKYIATNGSTVSLTPTASAGWRCVYLECSEGDKFTINGEGGGTPRLWCFTDSSLNVLKVAVVNKTGIDLLIVAPTDAHYLVLNDNANGTSYYGEVLQYRVDELEAHDEQRVQKGRTNDNLLFTATLVKNKYFTGSPVNSDSYDYFYMEVKNGVTYYFSQNARFLAYGINLATMTSTGYVENQTSYTPDKDMYIAVTFAKTLKNLVVATANNFANIGSFDTPYFSEKTLAQARGEDKKVPVSQYGAKVITETYFVNSKNMVDPTDMTSGFLSSATSISSSDSYITTGYIKVANGAKVTFSPRIRMFAVYNSSKAAITGGYDDTIRNNYTYTMPQDGYIRATFFVSDRFWQIELGESATKYEPYGYELKDSIIYNSYNGNALYLKKYVSCGDSFTEGEFTDDPNAHVFESGLYAGKNMVYPYYIGRRNYMVVINEAKSGSTMTYIDGTNNEFSKENGRYTKIPADADYITLKFGINDCHALVPIGTIDDAVNTTFYGAWNIVLEYLITNHPYAKIGMIIGNGLNVSSGFPGEDYAEAMRAIATKWGIPYLDEDKGAQVPLLLRTNKTDVTDAAKNLRNAAFRVASNNWHPNAKAHEYESTIVENFMRSL